MLRLSTWMHNQIPAQEAIFCHLAEAFLFCMHHRAHRSVGQALVKPASLLSFLPRPPQVPSLPSQELRLGDSLMVCIFMYILESALGGTGEP